MDKTSSEMSNSYEKFKLKAKVMLLGRILELSFVFGIAVLLLGMFFSYCRTFYSSFFKDRTKNS